MTEKLQAWMAKWCREAAGYRVPMRCRHLYWCCRVEAECPMEGRPDCPALKELQEIPGSTRDREALKKLTSYLVEHRHQLNMQMFQDLDDLVRAAARVLEVADPVDWKAKAEAYEDALEHIRSGTMDAEGWADLALRGEAVNWQARALRAEKALAGVEEWLCFTACETVSTVDMLNIVQNAIKSCARESTEEVSYPATNTAFDTDQCPGPDEMDVANSPTEEAARD